MNMSKANILTLDGSHGLKVVTKDNTVGVAFVDHSEFLKGTDVVPGDLFKCWESDGCVDLVISSANVDSLQTVINQFTEARDFLIELQEVDKNER